MKFTNPKLDGYGFDIHADRVVRYNKHPDGTYLNTRATYSINKQQYTHFWLRNECINQKPEVKTQTKNNIFSFISRYKWFIIFCIIIALGTTTCTVEFNHDISYTGA